MTQHIEEKIRARAYEIWEREGRPEGREQDHWDEAARELGAAELAGNGSARHHENFVSGVDDDEPAPPAPVAPAPAGRTGKGGKAAAKPRTPRRPATAPEA